MEFDARKWDEDAYRSSILKERELRSLKVFRTVFAPSQNPNPDVIVAASSDGSVAPYSLSSCISSYPMRFNKGRNQRSLSGVLVAEPICLLQGHNGPAYDVKFYGDTEDSLLLTKSMRCHKPLEGCWVQSKDGLSNRINLKRIKKELQVQNNYRIKKDGLSWQKTSSIQKQKDDQHQKQLQTPVVRTLASEIEEAAKNAAYMIADAENKAFMASEAVKESERVAKMAEDSDSVLQLAKETLERCLQGEVLFMA